MRLLTELPQSQAELLADVLLTGGTSALVRPGVAEGHAGVWVIEEDALESAKQTLAEFLADPTADRFAAAKKQAGRLRSADRKERKAAAKRIRRGRDTFRDAASMPLWQRAPISLGLLAACAAAAVFGWDPDGDPIYILWAREEPLLRWLYLVPVFEVNGEWLWNPVKGLSATFESGQLWRFVTPIFLHHDPLHLLFNSMWIVTLGVGFERAFGPWRLLAFVFVTAAGSNVSEYYADMQFGLPILGLLDFREGNPMGGGMSGVVYALFGFVWGRAKAGDSGVYLPPNTVFYMVGWLVICTTGELGPIGNIAHASGLLLGLAIGWISWKGIKLPGLRSLRG
ncbi:MAG: rhomboid family intramembrane serine protease [Planctomycetota bacterium]